VTSTWNFSTGDALLVAVTKGRSIDEIMRLYEKGIRDFGENRVQEALVKIEALPKDIRWHFIGKLQKNKVSKVIGKFHLIHSVDTCELAYSISRGAKEQITSILLQVNTSGEESKSGLSAEEWEAEIPALKKLPNLAIKGLMTMAPLTDDVSVIRHCFAALRKLRDKWGLKELSMGMSQDYKIALEEGATMVRIGRKLYEGN